MIRGGLLIAPPDDEDLLLAPPDRRDRCLILDGLITFSDVIDDCEEYFDDDDGILVVALELSTKRSSSKPLDMLYVYNLLRVGVVKTM